MNSTLRSLLKTFAGFAVLFVIYITAAGMNLRSYAPKPGVETFDDLKRQGVPMMRAVTIKSPVGNVCVFGDAWKDMWRLSSGPPAYLFDAAGRIVDYTVDVGDSTKFQYEYRVFSGEEIDLAGLPSLFEGKRD